MATERTAKSKSRKKQPVEDDKEQMQREFYARLTEAMRLRQMNSSQLATALHTSRATVSEWKRRGSWPTGYALVGIAHALDVNLHWLLTGEGGITNAPLTTNEDDTLGVTLVHGANIALSEVRLSLDKIQERYGHYLPSRDTKKSPS